LQRVYQNGIWTDQRVVNLKATDVTLESAPCLHLSYQPVVGTAGGPVTVNGEVAAINSFADPSKASTWARSLEGLPL
jgi:hypothetical protein